MPDKVNCRGKCGKVMPEDHHVTAGYRKGEGDALVDWICYECWEKGIRWTPKDKGLA